MKIKSKTAVEFLQLPSEKGLNDRQADFLASLSDDAVFEVVCASCAQFHWKKESITFDVDSIPHLHHLTPGEQHNAHQLMHGMLLECKGVWEEVNQAYSHLCKDCVHHL